MRKEKRKFLRVEMLVVRKEYQGQGYMRRMLEYAYRIAEDHRVPVILDTDDKNKAARYEHLGMRQENSKVTEKVVEEIPSNKSIDSNVINNNTITDDQYFDDFFQDE